MLWLGWVGGALSLALSLSLSGFCQCEYGTRRNNKAHRQGNNDDIHDRCAGTLWHSQVGSLSRGGVKKSRVPGV